MHVVLVSTYDLGRQPFGLASPTAWLREAGCEVTCVDVSRAAPTPQAFAGAHLVGFFLPMHTATRLIEPIVRRIRADQPLAHLCAYGLYAPTNRAWLESIGVHAVLGAEFEDDLLRLVERLRAGTGPERTSDGAPRADGTGKPPLARVAFRVPDRSALPDLGTYARLHLPDGRTRVVGYTEASRGCKHLCRHCPVVPVYEGRFRVVPLDVVLGDVRQQVAAGARHITFGDPDFFNGITHALRVMHAFHAEFPDVTYDATIKVEHLLQHADVLPLLRDTGCILVTSAVESLDDRVLALLDKGHTRADFQRALGLCRSAGVALAPTFIPFTPWTTIDSYRELLEALDDLDLAGQVPPIQLTLRLLVTAQSHLLSLPDIAACVGAYDAAGLVYPWTHVDPAVDALQRETVRLVAAMKGRPRDQVFDALRTLAGGERGARRVRASLPRPRTSVPYLNEPWYC